MTGMYLVGGNCLIAFRIVTLSISGTLPSRMTVLMNHHLSQALSATDLYWAVYRAFSQQNPHVNADASHGFNVNTGLVSQQCERLDGFLC